jgi:hypothetical protein
MGPEDSLLSSQEPAGGSISFVVFVLRLATTVAIVQTIPARVLLQHAGPEQRWAWYASYTHILYFYHME